MSQRLAVFTPQIGAVSETFVRRHVEDLLPGRTVVVARQAWQATGGRWTAPCPVLLLDRWALKLPVRVARRAGFSERSLSDHVVEGFLRRHGVDLVLVEYLDQFVDFVPLLDHLRIPYVVQGHGIDVSAALRSPGMAERYKAYCSARSILTRCEFHRQRLIAFGLPAEKVGVNPGGVDVPEQVPVRPLAAAKRFLAIGRMVAKKGPIYLLEAFRRAAAQDAEITLDYVGAGELFAAAHQFVGAAGLRDRVTLHGAASEAVKVRLLEECGVFVQHSITDPDTGDEEGLPAAIQEAMAHGLAVVSTRHAGIPEAVREGETGLLVEEGDAKAMAAAFLEIPGRAAAFGRAGYAIAAQAYTWEHEKTRLQKWLGLN